MPKLQLIILEDTFAICQLSPSDPLPDLSKIENFWSITKSSEEISIIISETHIPKNCKVEKNWRGFRIIGPLYFSLTGIIASISSILAKAGISIFSISTYDTDYFFVKEENLNKAKEVLIENGHSFV